MPRVPARLAAALLLASPAWAADILEVGRSTHLVGSVADGFGAGGAIVGDLQGDGVADVIVLAPAALGGDGRAVVYLGWPTGLGTGVHQTLEGTGGGGRVRGVGALGDLNGDGRADVLLHGIADGLPGSLRIHLGAASGLEFEPHRTITEAWGYAEGDIDGDGFRDLVAHHTGRLDTWLGGPSGLPGAPSASVAIDVPLTDLWDRLDGLGDYDGDGFDDVLVWGMDTVHVFAGSAAGLTDRVLFERHLTGDADMLGTGRAGDLDGDGRGDLWINGRHPDAAQFAHYCSVEIHSTGGGLVRLYRSPRLLGCTRPDATVPLGDINGDGRGDLAVIESASLGAWTPGIHLGPVSSTADGGAPAIPGLPVPGYGGSVNGDCADDVFVTTAPGLVHVYYGAPWGHPDADGDGYGDARAPAACAGVADGTDCDDTRDDVYPGAPAGPQPLDWNCDGAPEQADDTDAPDTEDTDAPDTEDTDAPDTEDTDVPEDDDDPAPTCGCAAPVGPIGSVGPVIAGLLLLARRRR